jgi:hypothetical protein
MPKQIDHIIVAVDAAYRPVLSAQLKAAGFVHGDAGQHGSATANENVAFAGGGFLELLYEQSPGSGPGVWFAETPRVQGIGVSTDDYKTDIAAWGTPPGSWDQMFGKVLETGESSECRAAGPIARDEFYVFYMDRPETDFTGLGATARLTDIIVRGEQHELWHDRFRDWFGLPPVDGGLLCGDVTFRFEPGPHPAVRLSLKFAVGPADAAVIPIAGGTIELAAAVPGDGQ